MSQAYHRVGLVAAATFVVTLLISGTTRGFLGLIPPLFSAFLLLIVVSVGVFFDVIGTAVISAQESPFHAMAAKRIFGAPQAVRLVRSADAVANFCNDLVGDIAGTLSGAMGAMLASSLQQPLLVVLIAPIVSTLTVTGKALGKGPAIKHANAIVYRVAWVLAWWEATFSRRRTRRRAGK
ncbi:MAG: hypothetical protein ACOYEP_07420 [Limnochordia bacterium]|jgi:Mg2+/Co2+ transporter CorB